MQPNDERVYETPSFTRKITFACGNLYITINEIDGNPFRVFLKLGKAGHCQRALLEAVARLVTIVLQDTDMSLDRICKTLGGIQCDKGIVGKKSCMDSLAKDLKKYVCVESENGDDV